MASTLELAVKTIQLEDYASLVVLTAVGYDYILTLEKEIEYIWRQPWTRVSTLFVLARYFGLCCVMTFALGEILLIFGIWGLWIFISAADVVMILRVWALYSRSRFILGILLVFYTIDFVLYLADCIILSTRDRVMVTTAQVFDYTLCVVQPSSPVLTEAINAFQIVLGALMCLLVIIQFLKQSLQMYKLTKRFQPGRYMSLFVREGMFYFLAILTYALLNMLVVTANIPLSGWWILLLMVQFIPTFTLVPRFILSLRELYARDLRGRRGGEIDTAFGLASAFGHDATMNTMVFAEAGQNLELQQGEDILMEER